MSHTLFVSDIHLTPKNPYTSEVFVDFLNYTAAKAEALYILGDLFEYWAGDEELDERFYKLIIFAMRDLTTQGTDLFIMRGNRDLLMGKKFEKTTGATLISDPALINPYGKPILLSHGDSLCTDDTDYQLWRTQVNEKGWQTLFLAQSLSQRQTQIEQLRTRSEHEKQVKSRKIMDVNADAITNLLREHCYPHLIHGHTHQPLHSLHHIDGKACERWVLGDWNNSPNALRLNSDGICWEIISGKPDYLDQ